PTVQNGGLDRDGMWVIWNLKRGVTWHDGRPFTADDVVFNWEFAADPASATVTVGSTRDLARGEINPNYHVPNRPFFDTFEMKGGGDAVSAARAVLQTGEFDYAWN